MSPIADDDALISAPINASEWTVTSPDSTIYSFENVTIGTGLTELTGVMRDWKIANCSTYKHSDIVIQSNGTEMLRIAENKFFVRGVEVPCDSNEANYIFRIMQQYVYSIR